MINITSRLSILGNQNRGAVSSEMRWLCLESSNDSNDLLPPLFIWGTSKGNVVGRYLIGQPRLPTLGYLGVLSFQGNHSSDRFTLQHSISSASTTHGRRGVLVLVLPILLQGPTWCSARAIRSQPVLQMPN